MSIFKVSIIARNIKDESLVSPPVEVLVDTVSALTWLPKDLLSSIGYERGLARWMILAQNW